MNPRPLSPQPSTLRVARIGLLALATVGPLCCAHAASLHVRLDSPNPTAPFATWDTAATNIQQAVDVAQSGDTVWVTNGVYATGGHAIGRVVVDKSIRLRSVYGPEVTVIRGSEGKNPVRGVVLAQGAVLSGFTVTGGQTQPVDSSAPEGVIDQTGSGGGVWCASDPRIAMPEIVTNCVLTGNVASSRGGGIFRGSLVDCTIRGNRAGKGGGAAFSSLTRCRLLGNSAESGGGAFDSTLRNCVVTGNTAWNVGGGTAQTVLYHCTLTGNSAWYGGGGIEGGAAYNCLVYFNRAQQGANYMPVALALGWGSPSTFAHCCTTPLPPGPGNIEVDPRLISASHLAAESPCARAGDPANALGTDIDGQPWANPPAIGADQPSPTPTDGPSAVRIETNFTEIGTGYPVSLTAHNIGPVFHTLWDFGDGTTSTNQAFATHAWTQPGVYSVTLTGFGGEAAASVQATVAITVVAAQHYVDLASPQPKFPYTSWATAATNIQDAIEATTTTGATVWVNDGTYRVGEGYDDQYGLTARVALWKPLIVRSRNGPAVTLIEGQFSDPEHGSLPLRCAYLGDHGILSGFTLTKGDAGEGGGAWCLSGGVLTNCVVSGNQGRTGGGVYGGTLYRCTVERNYASGPLGQAGGAVNATLIDCLIDRNGAVWRGGGVARSTLRRCTLSGNMAWVEGGGVFQSELHNCRLEQNTARGGAGAFQSVLHGCVLTGNSALGRNIWDGEVMGGGGALACELRQCTIIGNSSRTVGGGILGGAAYNCLLWFNDAPHGPNYNEDAFNDGETDYPRATLEYSCTSPLPPGPGNIDADPRLVSTSHLSPISPCNHAGARAIASGVDIDGDAWSDPPAIGADQPMAWPAGELPAPRIRAPTRRTRPGIPVLLAAESLRSAVESVWEFGDGTSLTNEAFAYHAWKEAGVYEVKLRGRVIGLQDGVEAGLTVHVTDADSYVNPSSPSPAFPYTSWSTAATSIQEAIAAAAPAGTVIWVTNGTYSTGTVEDPLAGRSRLALTNVVKVSSVHGAAVTIIEGGSDNVRCAWVGDGSVLDGFTLTGGVSSSTGRSWDGGGVWCDSTNAIVRRSVIARNTANGSGGGVFGGTLEQCLIRDNRCCNVGGGAYSSVLRRCRIVGNQSGSGGGVYEGTLNNCLVFGNSASGEGGGAAYSTLSDCTVVANSAGVQGGGVVGGGFRGCIVYSNKAPDRPNHDIHGHWSWLYAEFSCTSPSPPGPGNIDADPAFVSLDTGDFRLRPGSPCTDAGTNRVDLAAVDLLGGLRIQDGNGDGTARVDMGAFEFDPSAPFFVRFQARPDGLLLEWNPAAKGARLLRASRLESPSWLEVSVPPSATNTLVPLSEASGFYQLVKP